MALPDRYNPIWPIKRTGNRENELAQINKLLRLLIDDVDELSGLAGVGGTTVSTQTSTSSSGSGASIAGYVPYSGATQDIDLGSFSVDWPFIVGSPTSFTSYREYIENSSSAGIIDGCDLTDNGDGTVDIGTGIALLRDTSDRLADLYTVAVAAETGLTLTDNSVNYIYLDWNSGSPQFAVSTSKTAFNGIDKVVAYIIHRDGNNLDYLNLERQNLDVDARLLEYYLDTTRFSRVGSGSILDSLGLTINVTAGSFYFVLREVTHSAFDTSSGDTFSYFYQDGAGGWTETTGNAFIDTLQYDDGSGTLASLNSNDYGVNWIYLLLDEDPELDVVYGQENYEKLADALASSPPNSLPGKIESLGVLIGRVIFEQSGSSLMPESAFEAVFGFTTPISHNGLTGVQGGDVDERYHITANEHARLTAAPTVITTTSYTALVTDGTIIVDDDTAGGNVTIDLPGAATVGDNYQVIIFKKGSTGVVTIDPRSGQTINGEDSFDLVAQYESIKLLSDGSEWFIIEA